MDQKRNIKLLNIMSNLDIVLKIMQKKNWQTALVSLIITKRLQRLSMLLQNATFKCQSCYFECNFTHSTAWIHMNIEGLVLTNGS